MLPFSQTDVFVWQNKLPRRKQQGIRPKLRNKKYSERVTTHAAKKLQLNMGIHHQIALE